MPKSLLVGLSLIFAAWPASGSGSVVVPHGHAVMVDGKISNDEWADARRIEIPNGTRLYFKQADAYVYLCIRWPKGDAGFVDLYLSPGDTRVYDLHASAKLGQRVLSKGQWAEWTNWWNNEGWVANISRVDSFSERRFLPENVREFQIDRAYFPGPEWKIMLEISLAKGEQYTSIQFPANADKLHTDRWLPLKLR
jgi:hypothetical protein